MSKVVKIDTGLFLTDDPIVVQEYEEHGYIDFPSYDLFKEFFIEVGNNHPEGVVEEYFKQLYDNYTTSLSLKNLMDLNLVEEVVRDDGTVGYKLKNS